MREIKLRAWDGESLLSLGEPSRDTEYSRLTFSGDQLFTDDYQLMQYTGLKDKNGKEIYEGDVLSENDGNGRRFEVFWMDGTGEWDLEAGWWMRKHTGDRREVFPLHERSLHTGKWAGQSDGYFSMKVIGNIYENPELLK